jgi:hypothetical protein
MIATNWFGYGDYRRVGGPEHHGGGGRGWGKDFSFSK